MSRLNKKYQFYINEEENQQVYYFDIDEEGNPRKLGDGTYGVVYKIINTNEDELAVKLLYDNQSFPQVTQCYLTDELISSFRKRFKMSEEDPILQQLRDFIGISKRIGDWAIELKELKMSNSQLSYFLNEMQQEPESNSRQRYRHEMGSVRDIRRELKLLDRAEALTGVIEILGGTERFRSSKAFEALQSYFEESQIMISDYAIVMQLYKYTLKDLLEGGVRQYKLQLPPDYEHTFSSSPQLQSLSAQVFSQQELNVNIDQIAGLSQEQKDSLKKNTYELMGYDLLRTMGFEKRISTILPYLFNICSGLIALHLSRMYHYDLKPSNIFVRQRGESLEAVIGDLGFFKIQNIMSSTNVPTLPLGTRHFRSPEQKDYFDICDVEISHDVIKNNVALVITDPKFRDSIIEEGDFLIFSKDSTRTHYNIANILKSQNSTVIILEGSSEKLKERLKPDKRTQVFLYKNQAVRTDLFGFGALVFDMLTGGKSPERFYDNIRNYDTEKEDIEVLIERYRQVSTYQAAEPGLVHIFEPFKHEQKPEYAPEEIVELILKCILYKAKSTFYHTLIASSPGNHNEHRAMEAVLSKLQDLDMKYRRDDFNNALLKPPIIKAEDTEGSTILSNKIEEIQRMPLSELPLRLAQGVWYFRKLVDLFRNTIDNRDPFFAEVLPKNIIVNKDKDRLNFVYTAYKTEVDYKEDLKNDLVYAKITRDITNSYVPNHLTFMRRKIQLKPIDIPKGRFQYICFGSSPFGDNINEGDWVVINSELWKITSVSNRQITLKVDDQLNTSKLELEFDNKQEKFTEFVYYQNLDPCGYYLTMLGIYLYHLFFVGIGETTQDKPLLITIAQSSARLKTHSGSVQIKNPIIRIYSSNNNLKSILHFITRLYLKLIFPENEDGYYSCHSNDEARILAVSEDAKKLQKMVESFTEVMPSKFDKLVSELDDMEKLRKKIPLPFPKAWEFEELIHSYISISFKKRPNYYQELDQKFNRNLDVLLRKGQNSQVGWIKDLFEWARNQFDKGKIKLSYLLILIVAIIFLSGSFILFPKVKNIIGGKPEIESGQPVSPDSLDNSVIPDTVKGTGPKR